MPTFAQQTNTPDPQLRQRLVEVIKQHAAATNNNDAAAAACSTEDAVLVTDRGPVNGWAAIEKWYANWQKRASASKERKNRLDDFTAFLIRFNHN